jgi:hypothetical protein
MIWKQFFRDWNNLMYSTANFRIALGDVQWRKLKVSDDKQDIVGYHGTLTWPTYARGRTIVIEGLIIASTRSKCSMGMDWLDAVFALQWIPSSVETKELKIIDEQDREWIIQCKIEQPVDYEIEEDNDHNDGSMRRWRVSLFASDPKFYSIIDSVFYGQEGNYGGFALPNSMSNQRNMTYNEISCATTSNADQPVRITVTINGTVNTPLTVYNITAQKWFMLDINAIAGDVIVIDGKEQTATKNWSNILWTRVPGSQRPTVKAITKYVIYDKDGGMTTSDFSIALSFKNSLL